MFAVLLVQLWLGYSYMFLVSTGALQSIPVRPDRGGQRRRRQAVPRVPDHHLPAAAGGAGPAADRVVRLQLQQLQRDLPDHRGRPVPAGQPAVPAATDLLITYTYRLAFGGSGAAVRLRRGHLGLHLPDRRGHLDRQLPPHPGPGGDQLMTELDIRRGSCTPGCRRRWPPQVVATRQRQGRLVPPGRLAATSSASWRWPSRSSRSCSWCPPR